MAYPYRFANQSSSFLAVPISAFDTAIPLWPGDGALFPVIDPSKDEVFTLAIEDIDGQFEICWCTEVIGDILYVERGKEGTSALNWLTTTKVEHRVTAAVMNGISGLGGTGGEAFVFVGPEPPPGAMEGWLWWNTIDGNLYIYYVEDSQQWVSASVLVAESPDMAGYLPVAGGTIDGDLIVNGRLSQSGYYTTPLVVRDTRIWEDNEGRIRYKVGFDPVTPSDGVHAFGGGEALDVAEDALGAAQGAQVTASAALEVATAAQSDAAAAYTAAAEAQADADSVAGLAADADSKATTAQTSAAIADAKATAALGAVNDAMPKAGGDFTGMITIYAPPTAGNHPATKDYVDGIVTGGVDAMPISGGTFTGAVTMHADAVTALQPSTKQQLDVVNGVATSAASAASAAQAAAGAAQSTANTAQSTASAAQSTANAAMPKSGGVFTGSVTLSSDPVGPMQPATRQYTDVGDASVQAAADSAHAAAEAAQTTANAAQVTANAAMPKSGGAFTGAVTVAADPTVPLGVASKAYVDAHAGAASDPLKEDKANKGVANGYASLDSSTRVPAAQLPSYVDDVVEYANLAAFPATGTVGLIYVALDTNKIYRWSGSAYVEISPSPGSTDAVPEGSTNLYFTTARAAAAAPVQSVAGRTGMVTLTKADVGLGSVDNTSDAGKPVSTATHGTGRQAGPGRRHHDRAAHPFGPAPRSPFTPPARLMSTAPRRPGDRSCRSRAGR